MFPRPVFEPSQQRERMDVEVELCPHGNHSAVCRARRPRRGHSGRPGIVHVSGHYVAYRRRYVLNLRSVYIFTYGMGVCKPSSLINLLGTQRRVDFTVINWSFMQRIVKSKYSATFADSGRLTKIIELARRIDFSRSKSSLRLFAVNIKCRHRYLLTSVHFTP